MSELIDELRFRLRAGPRRTLTWVVDRLLHRNQDRRFGIATSRNHSSHPKRKDFVRYQPVSYRDLEESLGLASLTPDDVFLDIGSGMGRALCVAAMHCFRRVIGVEISPELCAIAEQNLARLGQRRTCPDVRVINADALEYTIPADVSLIFLFNPLSGAALDTLLEHVVDSHRKHPRALRILFTGTLSSGHFAQAAAIHRCFKLVHASTLQTGARALLYNVQDQR